MIAELNQSFELLQEQAGIAITTIKQLLQQRETVRAEGPVGGCEEVLSGEDKGSSFRRWAFCRNACDKA